MSVEPLLANHPKRFGWFISDWIRHAVGQEETSIISNMASLTLHSMHTLVVQFGPL